MKLVTNTYVGNATANRAITGIGFKPDLLWIRHQTGDPGVFATDETIGFFNLHVASLDTDGFTIDNAGGGNAAVNENGTTYHVTAFGLDSAVVATGTYTGDGLDNRDITGVGFRPDIVAVIRNDDSFNTVRLWTNQKGGDNTYGWQAGGSDPQADMIQSDLADGFQVGTSAAVNAAANKYYWWALQETTSNVDTSSYVGNGVDNRDISTLFTPQYVHILPTNGAVETNSAHRHEDIGGDNSWYELANSLISNRIQSIGVSLFQVGTTMNTDTRTYHILYLKNGIDPAPALGTAPLPPGAGPVGITTPGGPYHSYKTQRMLWAMLTGGRFF